MIITVVGFLLAAVTAVRPISSQTVVPQAEEKSAAEKLAPGEPWTPFYRRDSFDGREV
jgi:hypothetical protein